MEQMLSAFQCDLSSISSEIQTLQEQSVAMNLRLKNRQAVRSQLSQLVDELVVPATMISTILEAPVTEQEFLEQLHELNSKINYVKEQAFRETMACADVQHVLEKLKVKAITKIREFVLQKIYSFRKPMTNYQIPQNALLKYRFFYQFLLGNERAVAQELREQYVETMSKIYLSYFKSYTSRLMKIQYEEVAEKDDLMGVEDTAKKDILWGGLNGVSPQEFIEEILSPPFGGMIAFVKESEALIEKGQLERLRAAAARVTQLVRGFSSTWKAAVESLSQDVMRSFSNFKNGTSIIQGALTQLIQYYHRFHKVLSQPPLRALPARTELINIHHLMVELKKHKPNF
nr:PREDICTED: vacuolar protein sorting-associated protein 52 homolog [Apteryx mantelli mantelli]